MHVSPIINNKYKSQTPSFNAVNQKYYKKGLEEISWGNDSVTGGFMHKIQCEVLLSKKISPQDAADTLIALRECLKPKKDEWLNELIGEFKGYADKQRPQLKKFLKKVSQ